MKSRSALFWILLGAGFVASPLFPGNSPLIGPSGRSPIPVFDAGGNLSVVFQNGRAALSVSSPGGLPDVVATQELVSTSPVLGAAVERSADGRVGILWAQSGPETTDLLYGRLEGGRVLEIRTILRSRTPVFSPDLQYDRFSVPWAAWVNRTDRGDEVVVANLARRETWTVNQDCLDSALSPRLLAGAMDDIWVFWTGRDGGRDQIFSSTFRLGGWTDPWKLSADSRRPHLNPTAVLEVSGVPLIIWSAFDGENYQLFESRWMGDAWSPEGPITDGPGSNLSPSSVVVRGVPLLVWARSSGRTYAILAKVRQDGVWSGDIRIVAGLSAPLRSPRLANSDDRIALTWEADGRVESRLLSLDDILRAAATPALSQPGTAATPILGGDRDESQYTTFGDSITFAENIGYQPRLEPMLMAKFGPTTLWNEGVGGETTVDGLVRIEDAIAAHPSRQLLLMEGTNDVIFLEISMDTASFNLEEMAKRCLRSGLLPVISTIIPRKDWRWFVAPFQSRIVELNARIRILAETMKIPIVDQYDAFYGNSAADGGWMGLLLDDGIHPNPQGFQVMAETWYQGILLLPFAPVNVRQTASSNKTLFATLNGNLVSWQNSLKAAAGKIFAFRLYRRDIMTESAFKYLATVSFLRNAKDIQFFDTTIVPTRPYLYAVAALRIDGVEGTCSETAQLARY